MNIGSTKDLVVSGIKAVVCTIGDRDMLPYGVNWPRWVNPSMLFYFIRTLPVTDKITPSNESFKQIVITDHYPLSLNDNKRIEFPYTIWLNCIYKDGISERFLNVTYVASNMIAPKYFEYWQYLPPNINFKKVRRLFMDTCVQSPKCLCLSDLILAKLYSSLSKRAHLSLCISITLNICGQRTCPNQNYGMYRLNVEEYKQCRWQYLQNKVLFFYFDWCYGGPKRREARYYVIPYFHFEVA